MNTAAYKAIRVGREKKFTEDVLSIEVPLEIRLNGKEYSTTMCSPEDANELVRGLFYTEDIWRGDAHQLMITSAWNEDSNVFCADVFLDENLLGDGYSASRNLLSVTSCGICGSPKWNPTKGKLATSLAEEVSSDFIPSLFSKMAQFQSDFKASGGSHAAALFNKRGELISMGQDIGRHNAVDKAIGKCLSQGNLTEAHYLLVSGRLSYEIVSKAFAAKTPVLAAVSAPSTLAVDFAAELGICLLGFCRDDRFTIYSHPEHLNYDA
ncbi:MAG: formate dehydrogenase accessory sulfurtransferase FdhD [Flavobacteriales bacterium]|nr:formate dehydrogenase accessory sulfurtransferase FdhD [Flavobacteriales bacterium]